MTNRDIHIGIGSMEQFGTDFIQAWQRGEKNVAGEVQTEQVRFLDLATLLNTLTPKRLEILQALQHQSGTTTYQLAKCLGRHYKNVHTDVRLLRDIGLIETDNAGTGLRVPFTKIHAEIDLAA